MAGMLPGVEAARRRRIHQNSSNNPTSTHGLRRSSFCLYASSHELQNLFTSSNSSFTRKASCDESSLGTEAREAKKRLDERLQPQWRPSETTRNWNGEAGLQVKKGGGAKRWLKMRWKSSEQEECTVCLEQLKALNLMQLPCGHKFHKNCLLPWLLANAHCPCCRMQINPSSIFI